ncbi:phage/plasmid primase, P4 family [Halorientalis marina]|uniref:phage/plasmid primase, P4 family n=1 Tax=Halorientalis marina TaxID=2931976 RepID=UPI001FF5BAE0|nr:phage/plasmid primase, P4 family [Halorientalis marina]
MNQLPPKDAYPEWAKAYDNWALWSRESENAGKPLKKNQYGASWSDPDCGYSFEDAYEAAQSDDYFDGIGLVVPDDAVIYGIDLDGCLREPNAPKPKDWVPKLDLFVDDAYIEYSKSGTGLHIFAKGNVPEWWTNSHFSNDEHEGVEAYDNKFFIFTGDRLPISADTPEEVDPRPWLMKAYKGVRGRLPTLGTPDADSDDYDGSHELSKADIENALDSLNPDMGHSEWVRMAFAVYDWDDGNTGRSVFESWSRQGSKFDSAAESTIEWVWSNADDGDSNNNTSLGSLIYEAKQNGWSYPTTDGGTTTQQQSSDRPAGNTDSDESDDGDGWDYVRGQYQAASTKESPVEKNDARFEAAEQLLDEFRFANREDDDVLFVYDESSGIYEENGESVIRQRARKGLQGAFARQEVGELAEHIRAARTYAIEEFGGPEWHIALDNGVLRIDRGGNADLLNHDPEYLFINQAGTRYDPDADCPRWKRYLKETVKSDTHRMKLQEYAGYCLMHWGMPEHKALFLVGPQASGKSTFADTIRALLGGADNVASMAPQQMTSRFGTAELFSAWANIRNDIPPKTIEETGTFKEITAGDPIKAERKGKPLFHFRPTAKHIFSANQLPDAEDDDGAFYRRVLLVPFPTTIPREQRNKSLDDKLRDELPGILNWALDGLSRLLQQDGFTGDLSVHETAETWDKWGNTVDRFAKVCLETSGSGTPKPKKEVYAMYQRFCDDENFPADTQRKMTRRLKTEHGIQDGHATVDGRQQRCFLNVEYTSRAEQYQESDDDDVNGSGLGDYS